MIPQGVIDEQMKRWGELLTQPKIRALASRVHHLAEKQRVSNEVGMFIMLVKEAVGQRIAEWEKTQSVAERERHALFMLELFRYASNGEAPRFLASCMREARSNGFPQLDGILIQRLEDLGVTWEREIV